jgi:hypothetical protein
MRKDSYFDKLIGSSWPSPNETIVHAYNLASDWSWAIPL